MKVFLILNVLLHKRKGWHVSSLFFLPFLQLRGPQETCNRCSRYVWGGHPATFKSNLILCVTAAWWDCLFV